MTASDSSALVADLRRHLELCRELHHIIERESRMPRESGLGYSVEFFQKKSLLPFLDQSLNKLRQHRVGLGQSALRKNPGSEAACSLLRELQDLIMRIIVIDREVEQSLLRKGLVPARHLPSADRQRPQYVAGLYGQQQSAGVALRARPSSPG
jgi:hypothetical protein